MDKRDMKIKIRDYLLNTPGARSVNDSEVTVRCIFCGDSQKNRRETHLYIKIDVNNDSPIFFNCFRASCGAHGLFTPQTLREFDIHDLEISSRLTTYNNKAIRTSAQFKNSIDNKINLSIPKYKNETEVLYRKKKYIEDRLGVILQYEDLYKLKTVFNLYDFLRLNGIEHMTVEKWATDKLHKNYIGFLTVRNEFINFRNIEKNSDMRYVKYSIFNNLDNTKMFYTIPNEIDLLSNKKITINIAEGVFDILGVYYHLYSGEMKNMIYSSVLSAGYSTVIKYFIRKGIFGSVDINIYSDGDLQPYFYKHLIDDLNKWVDNINIYYNDYKGEKDFGVGGNKIKLIRKKL